jgi:nucleotide-binding universal stress UspA family protein
MSFKKILCPTDFSPGSRQALRVAARLANEADSELVVLHTWDVPPMTFGGEHAFRPDLLQLLRGNAERSLEVAARDAIQLGAKHVTSRLLTGVPWTTITGSADSDPAIDLIVIGTHGRTGFAHLLLGSVTEQVVRHAPCSVLAVRPDSEPRPFTHVLCPMDFSDYSRQAIDLAVQTVHPGGAGITLLRVLELPITYTGEPPLPDLYRNLDRHSAELLEAAAAELRSRVAVPVVTQSRVGRPGAETLAVLDDDPTFTLVVMGSYGRTGIKRVLLGSVAEKVVRHAKCPVLVARKRR